ncbi:hypothetical protein FGO68_gene8216 [Halteria grandinella]|uniref:FCP1 homology domain-containing protein n=1 Tax=Halteria grandinella TaxID=5974 RepID=A0A8J8P1Z2_HALGN|nr:hypothetical protein FGO68_gene8216 [Halteria grandinella]
MKKQTLKKPRQKNCRGGCSPSGGASSFVYIPHNIGAAVRSGLNHVTQSGIPRDRDPITPKSRGAGSVSKKGGVIRKSYNLVEHHSSVALNGERIQEEEPIPQRRVSALPAKKGGHRGRFVSQSKSRTRGAAGKQNQYDEESKDNYSRANDYQSFASHAQYVESQKKNQLDKIVKNSQVLEQVPSALVLPANGLLKGNNIGDRDDLDLEDNFSAALTAKMNKSTVLEQPATIIPTNKYMAKAKEAFEKLRKQEISGKIPIYPQIFQSSQFFKEVYQENVKAAKKLLMGFKRHVFPNYGRRQQLFAKRTKKRKTIVFDIDETLVLASSKPHSIQQDVPPQQSNTTTIKFSGGWRSASGEPDQMAYLIFRPYLLEMLIELYQDFEIILFTKGTLEYAQAFSKAVHNYYFRSKLARPDFFSHYAFRMEGYGSGLGSRSPARTVRALDSSNLGFFSHVLSFKECLYSGENQMHLKDLKILEVGRNLQDIIIVDNTIKSFYLHMTNGIPIHDFEGDPTDRALFHLTTYLKSFLHEEDVRHSSGYGESGAAGMNSRKCSMNSQSGMGGGRMAAKSSFFKLKEGGATAAAPGGFQSNTALNKTSNQNMLGMISGGSNYQSQLS